MHGRPGEQANATALVHARSMQPACWQDAIVPASQGLPSHILPCTAHPDLVLLVQVNLIQLFLIHGLQGV